MADGGDERLAGLAGGDRARPRARRRPGACASSVWPMRSPVAWTARLGRECRASAACSSAVMPGDAGRAGDDERPGRGAELRPTAARARRRRCRAARRERSDATPASAASGRGAARGGMLARIRAPGRRRRCPGSCRRPRGRRRRGEGALPEEAAHLVDQQHVGALGVVGAADQEDVDLAGGDARLGDAQGVDAGLLPRP